MAPDLKAPLFELTYPLIQIESQHPDGLVLCRGLCVSLGGVERDNLGHVFVESTDGYKQHRRSE